jgi:uncharacterized small protein (TIGR04563 family)
MSAYPEINPNSDGSTPTLATNVNGQSKRKQTLYLPESMLKEIMSEAARQDRSLSWLVQKAWRFARLTIKDAPSANDPAPTNEP